MSKFNLPACPAWRIPSVLSIFTAVVLVQGAGSPVLAAEPEVVVSEVKVAQAQQQPAQPVQQVQPLPQPNFEMIRALYELTALKEELKVLRNRVEEMHFKQEIGARRQQDLILDMDRRLTDLEQNQQEFLDRLEALASVPMPTSEEIPAEGGAIADDATDAATGIGETVAGQTPEGAVPEEDDGQAGGTDPVDTVTVSSARPEPDDTPVGSGTGSVSLNEQDAYDAAFEALKQSRYQDAIEQFQALVNTWPESQLADDSFYWMSEAYYVTREFEAALNGFRTLVQRYPGSSRVPEAMLKVGYIQYDIGAYDEAAKTFENILARFPGHQVTVSASIRLRRIKQTIQ